MAENVNVYEKHVCSKCAEGLSRTGTSMRAGNGFKEITNLISPCSNCIDQAVADRPVVILVREVPTGENEVGEPVGDHVLASYVFKTSLVQANALLGELVKAGETDLSGVVFTWETHKALVLSLSGK